MKLIITIVSETETESIARALVQKGFGVTHIASTGGLLRRGSATLLIGVEDARVAEAIENIRTSLPSPTEGSTARATLFVVAVENFLHV